MIDVSIIIVNFNTKKLTVQCIESVLKDSPGFSKEVIVVDNGSDDGSVKVFRDYQVRLIENKENLGFARANNQGIKEARGKYILLLNSDTKVIKAAIGKLIDFAESEPDAGTVGPKLLNQDGSIQPSVFNLPTVGRAIKQFWFGKNGLLDKYSPSTINQSPKTVESLVMAAFLITPKALKKVGLLTEKYFMYFEDFDYCRRVQDTGLKVYYLPSAEVIHYHGASGKSISDEKNQWRRLIPSSKLYHGLIKHYLINFVIWSGQKITKMMGNFQV